MSEELLNTILAQVVSIRAFIDEEAVRKSELKKMEEKILTHMDGFIKLHETLDQKIILLRSKVNRLEERLQTVEMRLGIMPV